MKFSTYLIIVFCLIVIIFIIRGFISHFIIKNGLTFVKFKDIRKNRSELGSKIKNIELFIFLNTTLKWLVTFLIILFFLPVILRLLGLL